MIVTRSIHLNTFRFSKAGSFSFSILPEALSAVKGLNHSLITWLLRLLGFLLLFRLISAFTTFQVLRKIGLRVPGY